MNITLKHLRNLQYKAVTNSDLRYALAIAIYAMTTRMKPHFRCRYEGPIDDEQVAEALDYALQLHEKT